MNFFWVFFFLLSLAKRSHNSNYCLSLIFWRTWEPFSQISPCQLSIWEKPKSQVGVVYFYLKEIQKKGYFSSQNLILMSNRDHLRLEWPDVFKFSILQSRFNPVWHGIGKQEKCSCLEQPRGNLIQLNELGRVSKYLINLNFSPPKEFGYFW